MRDFDHFSHIKKIKQTESKKMYLECKLQLFSDYSHGGSRILELFLEFQPYIFTASILLPSWGVLCSHFSTTSKTSCFCRQELWGEPVVWHAGWVKAGWAPPRGAGRGDLKLPYFGSFRNVAKTVLVVVGISSCTTQNVFQVITELSPFHSHQGTKFLSCKSNF